MEKIIMMGAFLIFVVSAFAGEPTIKMNKVEFVGIRKADCVRRVQIKADGKPSPQIVRNFVEKAYKITKNLHKSAQTVTIFAYLNDMPMNQAAYVVAEGSGETIETYRVNEQQYEFWQLIKSQSEK